MFEETLYLRDDEADEFGDSGAYGDTLEEDYDEEEEEEESELPSAMEEEPEPVAEPQPAAPAPATGGGGGGGRVPARKPAKKKAAKKRREIYCCGGMISTMPGRSVATLALVCWMAFTVVL